MSAAHNQVSVESRRGQRFLNCVRPLTTPMVPPGAVQAASRDPSELRLNLDLNIGPLLHPWPFAPSFLRSMWHTFLKLLLRANLVRVLPTTKRLWPRCRSYRFTCGQDSLITKTHPHCTVNRTNKVHAVTTNLQSRLMPHASLPVGQ